MVAGFLHVALMLRAWRSSVCRLRTHQICVECLACPAISASATVLVRQVAAAVLLCAGGLARVQMYRTIWEVFWRTSRSVSTRLQVPSSSFCSVIDMISLPGVRRLMSASETTTAQTDLPYECHSSPRCCTDSVDSAVHAVIFIIGLISRLFNLCYRSVAALYINRLVVRIINNCLCWLDSCAAMTYGFTTVSK